MNPNTWKLEGQRNQKLVYFYGKLRQFDEITPEILSVSAFVDFWPILQINKNLISHLRFFLWISKIMLQNEFFIHIKAL